MQDSLAVLSPELVPIHEKLVNIRRKLVTLGAKEKVPKSELKPLVEELRNIDSLSAPCAHHLKHGLFLVSTQQ